MGIFRRPDSPYWWLYLEGPKQRERTDILVNGTAEKREAKRRYFARMLEQAQDETDALLVRKHVEDLERRTADGRLVRQSEIDELRRRLSDISTRARRIRRYLAQNRAALRGA